MSETNSIRILALGAALPKKCVTNDDLAKIVDTSDEWIKSHTGIEERHFVEDETTSDLAIEAIRNMDADISDVDGIIVATATPDYIGFPSTACVIAEKMQLMNVTTAFDLAAGCTGFIYAMENARALISSGSCKKMIVVGAESLSKIVDFTDRNTCVLFGDGAGCALVEKGEGLKNSLLGCEKAGAEKLYVNSDGHIKMDGRAVYNFAVKRIVSTLNDLLTKNDLTYDDIKWIIPHQANIRIIKAAASRLKIDENKFYTNVNKAANTSAASVPIALKELEASGKLQDGDNILLVGFGAGLTYGGNYIKWTK